MSRAISIHSTYVRSNSIIPLYISLTRQLKNESSRLLNMRSKSFPYLSVQIFLTLNFQALQLSLPTSKMANLCDSVFCVVLSNRDDEMDNNNNLLNLFYISFYLETILLKITVIYLPTW